MIGLRENGKRKRGVGGKAFPHDYNWTCNVCGSLNRAFEPTCPSCEYNKRMESPR
jgi:rubrerythrin